jgi:TonB-linked SusC/RagA family outer membrane protein
MEVPRAPRTGTAWSEALALATSADLKKPPRTTILLALAMLLTPEASLAQQGVIAGTVSDAGTLEPVSGAQVFIPGTVIGTITDEDGTYRLRGVPATTVTVRVRLIGYKEASREVEVSPAGTVTADFQVEQTALRLQDLVVTGLVAETPRVKLPFTVERLDAADLPVPASDVSALLSGKAPGVTVVQPSGQPGQPAAILLRGPTSIDATGRTQAPLIVIDGVIQSQSASLSDINALDVDHIEIVKGAAAASLYGSRAQAGVVQVTTRRGTSLSGNVSQLAVRGEFGVSDVTRRVGPARDHVYVMNEAGTRFIDTQGNEVTYQEFNRNGNSGPVVRGGGSPFTTFQDQRFPGPLFDPLDQFFDPGETLSAYGSLTGRFGESSYRVSVEYFNEEGVVDCGDPCRNELALQNFGPDFQVRDDGYRRWNSRLNVDTGSGAFDFAASGFYSSSVQDDAANASESFFRLGLATPFIDLTVPDETGLPLLNPDPVAIMMNPLYVLAIAEDQSRRTRTMGSIDASWSPASWLTLELNGSFDRTDFEAISFRPKDEKFGLDPSAEPTFTGGRLSASNFTEEAINASATASLRRSFLDGSLTARARLRYLVENQDFGSSGVSGSHFAVKDVPTFEALTGDQTGERELREIRAAGYFGIVGLDYKGRYILDGLIRRDGSSLFGPEERWHTYYRGSVAWRPSQEDFWKLGWWDELKLRFSVGTAGGRPNFFTQFETYGVSAGTITPINLGNVNIKPEHTLEREAGLDLVLFDELGLNVTYAWGTTDDQILLAPVPSFQGFSAQWRNAGEIQSDTWEASLRWAPADTPDWGLSFRLNWDRTTQEITRFDIAEFRDWHVFAEGEPLGSLWGTVWSTTCEDVAFSAGLFSSSGFDCDQFQVNDDGYLVFVGEGNSFTDGISEGLWGTQGEVAGRNFRWGMPISTERQSRVCLRRKPEDRGVGVECPLTDVVPITNTMPDWNGSLGANVRYRGLAVSFLWDAVVGLDLLNGRRNSSRREKDQGGKPDGLKKPLRYYDILAGFDPINTHFIEDASWLKLRELSIGYTLPESWVRRVLGSSVDRVTLTAIGRNLLTLTGYSGYDPEVGLNGLGSAALDRRDFFGYPQFRTISLSLEAVF